MQSVPSEIMRKCSCELYLSFVTLIALISLSESSIFVQGFALLLPTTPTPSLGMKADDSSSSEQSKSPVKQVKCPNCNLCDGSGRIAGGIGALIPWIPIKAYRPCPNFVDSGGTYERMGQGLDEIAFGRDSTFLK